MKRQDIVFGGLLFIIVLIAYFYFKGQSNLNVPNEPTPTISLEEKVEGRFDTKLPPNIEKTELKPLKPSDSFAAATRDFSDNQFILTILADLPDPESGKFYQAWLKITEDQMLSLGQLREAKGGWLLEFDSTTDYSNQNEIFITLETSFDQTPEEVILQGSF